MSLTNEKLEFIKNKVQILIDKGATKSYAVSVVCDDMKLNSKSIMKLLFPESSNEKTNYEDIKTSVGSLVVLKNNPSDEYKVININNKNSIDIVDIDNDSKIENVKEEDIIPVVTETQMKKSLKEANYNLSIDGLETTDAETLSQMLSLAGQADTSNGFETSSELPDNGSIADMDDMMNSEPSTEYDVIDASGNDFETSVTDEIGDVETSISAMEDEIDDTFGYEDYEQYPVSESKIEEDVLLDPRTKDETFNAEKDGALKYTDKEKEYFDDEDEFKNIEESEDDDALANDSYGVDNFMSDYFYDNAELQSEFDYDDLEEYKEEIYSKWQELTADGEDEWVAAEMSASEVLPNSTDKDTAKRWDAQNVNEEFEESEDFDEEIIEETEDTSLEIDGEDDFDEEIIEESDDIDFDDEIAECLRLAGVELNEVSDEKATKGKKDLPNVVGKKTAFSCAKKDGFKPGENQRPDYRCVKRENTMGKESSEGFAKPMRIESMVNRDKIQSICETATRMYAKKDHNEWLALDRRYVEKLIKEGCSYTRASKLLLKAKKGK